MSLTGVCIITPDVRRLRDFYTFLLGVQAEGSDTFASLATAGGTLSLFTEEGMEQMASGVMAGAGRGAYTLEFRLESAAAVDAAYERLLNAGVLIAKPPTTQTWGRRSVWIRDPDGNLVNLYADLPQP
jgi:catechol 2,3-dioxygenase-like lactoylglutathione lyase family enzyme